jgi:hypothetical protein
VVAHVGVDADGVNVGESPELADLIEEADAALDLADAAGDDERVRVEAVDQGGGEVEERRVGASVAGPVERQVRLVPDLPDPHRPAVARHGRGDIGRPAVVRRRERRGLGSADRPACAVGEQTDDLEALVVVVRDRIVGGVPIPMAWLRFDQIPAELLAHPAHAAGGEQAGEGGLVRRDTGTADRVGDDAERQARPDQPARRGGGVRSRRATRQRGDLAGAGHEAEDDGKDEGEGEQRRGLS